MLKNRRFQFHLRTMLVVCTIVAIVAAYFGRQYWLAQQRYRFQSEYWIPQFEIGAMLPEQTELIPKLGGFPWGYPLEKWPRCTDCGHAMSHLPQFPHNDKALDLGDQQSVLHIFECNHDPGMCNTWDFASGANQCVVLSRQELSAGLTRHPESPEIIGEYQITDWKNHATPSFILDHADSFYDGERFDRLNWNIVQAGLNELFENSTKMGGVPYWTGNGGLKWTPIFGPRARSD